jgi:hypothetical protein
MYPSARLVAREKLARMIEFLPVAEGVFRDDVRHQTCGNNTAGVTPKTHAKLRNFRIKRASILAWSPVLPKAAMVLRVASLRRCSGQACVYRMSYCEKAKKGSRARFLDKMERLLLDLQLKIIISEPAGAHRTVNH